MERNNLIKIYNNLQEELDKAPLDDDKLSKIEVDIYADMQNLKEILTQYFVEEHISKKKAFEFKESNMIGLNKYLYTFNNKEELKEAKDFLCKIGTVKEVFSDNEYKLEFKEDTKLLLESIVKFSKSSQRTVANALEEIVGIPVTIGDENIEGIKEEMGKTGVEIYEKYYNWYAENGEFDFYDYIDSFCYGKIDEIKGYLNEVIEYTKENEKNELDLKNTILEVENDIERLNILQNQKEEEEDEL